MPRLAAPMLALALAVLAPAEAGAAAPADVTGLWLTQDRKGVISIQACGSSVCGTIVGTTTPAQCRLNIINAAPAGHGVWSGHITNPDDGSVWNAELRPGADDRLYLRGYVLLPLLGETQVWTRYTGRLADDCRMV